MIVHGLYRVKDQLLYYIVITMRMDDLRLITDDIAQA